MLPPWGSCEPEIWERGASELDKKENEGYFPKVVPDWPKALDIVVIPRYSARKRTFHELKQEFIDLMRRGKVF